MDSSFKHQQEVEELAKQVKQKTATEKNQDESMSQNPTQDGISREAELVPALNVGGKLSRINT
jgi:hypothetical protein